jgi:hypothetical protein
MYGPIHVLLTDMRDLHGFMLFVVTLDPNVWHGRHSQHSWDIYWTRSIFKPTEWELDQNPVCLVKGEILCVLLMTNKLYSSFLPPLVRDRNDNAPPNRSLYL